MGLPAIGNDDNSESIIIEGNPDGLPDTTTESSENHYLNWRRDYYGSYGLASPNAIIFRPNFPTRPPSRPPVYRPPVVRPGKPSQIKPQLCYCEPNKGSASSFISNQGHPVKPKPSKKPIKWTAWDLADEMITPDANLPGAQQTTI